MNYSRNSIRRILKTQLINTNANTHTHKHRVTFMMGKLMRSSEVFDQFWLANQFKCNFRRHENVCRFYRFPINFDLNAKFLSPLNTHTHTSMQCGNWLNCIVSSPCNKAFMSNATCCYIQQYEWYHSENWLCLKWKIQPQTHLHSIAHCRPVALFTI